MSNASICVETRTEAWIERLQPWIAALISLLLHLLALLILLSASTPVVTTSDGGDGGSRVKVDFIGESSQPQQQAPPSPPPSPARRPVQPAAAASPVRSTLVDQADDPVPPRATVPAEGLTAAPAPRPAERPEESPQPSDAPADTPQSQARRPAANPPATTRRRPHVWGQPPGMLAQDTAPVNAGRASSPATGRGRGNDSSSSQPNLEVGGYQVYYDLRSEAKLRDWRDQGMTELFLPLPGTTKYMICPLEIALRRESGPCRLLDPDSPEMANIGDAREVIFMQQVYRQGELVWRGPGAYR